MECLWSLKNADAEPRALFNPGGKFIGDVDLHWDADRVLFSMPGGSDRWQVFDAEGKAVQLMRSWMTAMPGETVQCTGCHDRQNSAPPTKSFLAMRKPPSDITPWHGPVRGFSYPREVQPVIDRHCVGCHDGAPRTDGITIPDLRGAVKLADWSSVTPGNGGYAKTAGKFGRISDFSELA